MVVAEVLAAQRGAAAALAVGFDVAALVLDGFGGIDGFGHSWPPSGELSRCRFWVVRSPCYVLSSRRLRDGVGKGYVPGFAAPAACRRLRCRLWAGKVHYGGAVLAGGLFVCG